MRSKPIRVCTREMFRVKYSVFHNVIHYRELYEQAIEQNNNMPNALVDRLNRLVELLDIIIVSEWAPGIGLVAPNEDPTSFLSCDFCGGDIFVTYMECSPCGEKRWRLEANEVGDCDPIAICSLCYATGRSCKCMRKMKIAQQARFQDIVDERNRAVDLLERHANKSFELLNEE